ncbi:MAG: GAF domain-containing protein [Pelobacteraceae bacterium]
MRQDGTDLIIHDKLAGLMEMAALVNSSLKRSVIMDHSVKSICRLTQAEAGSLLLVDHFTGHLDFEVVMGEQSDILPFFRVPKGQGIAGWVAENDTPLIVPDVQTDERFYRYVDQELKFTTREMIAVPLRADGVVIGVLQVINKQVGVFNHDDLKLAMAFANQIAAVINKTKNEKQCSEKISD